VVVDYPLSLGETAGRESPVGAGLIDVEVDDRMADSELVVLGEVYEVGPTELWLGDPRLTRGQDSAHLVLDSSRATIDSLTLGVF
jgi:hypothetical protein